MLRLTLTLVPRGNEQQARELGTVEIENDGTEAEVVGSLIRMRGFRYADAEVRGFSRVDSPWVLAMCALRAIFS